MTKVIILTRVEYVTERGIELCHYEINIYESIDGNKTKSIGHAHVREEPDAVEMFYKLAKSHDALMINTLE